MEILVFLLGTSGAINLGQITTYNASDIPGYQNLSVDNFIVEIISANYAATGGYGSSSHDLFAQYSGITPTKSYDASTGIFTLSNTTNTLHLRDTDQSQKIRQSAGTSISYRVWLIIL